MRTNVRAKNEQQTFEVAPAHPINTMQALRRSVSSCLLFEREFYEEGETIAHRIESLAMKADPEALAKLAVEVRSTMNLRHAPMPLLYALSITGAGKSGLVRQTVCDTIQRPDEIAEFAAFYWGHKHPSKARRPLSAQVKQGLALAFAKFDEHRLAKYDRDDVVKMRDVMRMVRPVPEKGDQEALFGRVLTRTLETPDTWEVALSSGADKKDTFTRLIREGNLGYLALLRNLRNMTEAGVDMAIVKEAILARRGARRVLPFRYVAAARVCPQLEPVIDRALCASISEMSRLKGRTVALVDVSGSMGSRLSMKSDLTRMDAAAALSSVINAEDLRVFSFSGSLVEVPARRGMAGIDAVVRSQPHGATYLGRALETINKTVPHDRLIVVTDEQSHDRVPDPVADKAYMINVASARNGVGYGRWTHIDGFSESVIRFIHDFESID